MISPIVFSFFILSFSLLASLCQDFHLLVFSFRSFITKDKLPIFFYCF